MATFIGRRFFSGQFLKRILQSKRCTGMYFCTKPDEEFTGVLLKNRGHIEVYGEHSVTFLQGLLTNDVNLFHCDSLMTALYAVMLNTKGRVLYDLILYKQKRETPGFLIECDSLAVGNILKTFGPYKLRSKVVFNDVTDKFNSWAIMEEEGVTGLQQTDEDLDFVTLVEDPRITLLGARLVLPKNKGAAEYFSNVKEISDQAVYDRHRVGLGVAEGIRDIEPGMLLPLESNIDELHGGQYSLVRVIFIDLSSAYLAEMEFGFYIVMLKLVCVENFVLFGHSGHKLWHFENLVFHCNLLYIIYIEFVAAVIMT